MPRICGRKKSSRKTEEAMDGRCSGMDRNVDSEMYKKGEQQRRMEADDVVGSVLRSAEMRMDKTRQDHHAPQFLGLSFTEDLYPASFKYLTLSTTNGSTFNTGLL